MSDSKSRSGSPTVSAPEPHKLAYLPTEASARDARFLARLVAILTAAYLGAAAIAHIILAGWPILTRDLTLAEFWNNYGDYPIWARVIDLAHYLVFPASAFFFTALASTRRVWIWPLLVGTAVEALRWLSAVVLYEPTSQWPSIIQGAASYLTFLAEAALAAGLFILFLTPAFRRSVNAGR